MSQGPIIFNTYILCLINVVEKIMALQRYSEPNLWEVWIYNKAEKKVFADVINDLEKDACWNG